MIKLIKRVWYRAVMHEAFCSRDEVIFRWAKLNVYKNRK